MNTILVTGATSCIAVSLIKRLLKDGYYVHAVVRPKSDHLMRLPQHENLRIYELEMSEIHKLDGLVINTIDAVYHFAWEGVRGAKRDDKMLQEKNYHASIKCVKAAVESGIPYFIGIGSQAEYGITEGLITEDACLRPVTEYGKMKARTFYTGQKICDGTKTQFVWARIFSVYGREDDKNTLLMQCIEKMKKNETIDLSPCEHMWDYTYIEDVSDALLLLLKKRVPAGAYNISYGEPHVLKEYVLRLKQMIGSDSQLNFGKIPYGNQGVIQMNPCIDKIRKAVGWEPKTDFESGIEKILEEEQ